MFIDPNKYRMIFEFKIEVKSYFNAFTLWNQLGKQNKLLRDLAKAELSEIR